VRATVIGAVPDAADEQAFASAATLDTAGSIAAPQPRPIPPRCWQRSTAWTWCPARSCGSRPKRAWPGACANIWWKRAGSTSAGSRRPATGWRARRILRQEPGRGLSTHGQPAVA
jgi:hypothetical protein